MKTLKQIGILLAALLCATTLFAQTTATPTSRISWNQLGQSAAIANSATYPLYIDGAVTSSTSAASVTCAASVAPLDPATDSTCVANFPALTPGTHTLTITQSISGVESAHSNQISFTFVVVVTPSGLRIVSVTRTFTTQG